MGNPFDWEDFEDDFDDSDEDGEIMQIDEATKQKWREEEKEWDIDLGKIVAVIPTDCGLLTANVYRMAVGKAFEMDLHNKRHLYLYRKSRVKAWRYRTQILTLSKMADGRFFALCHNALDQFVTSTFEPDHEIIIIR